VSRSPVPGPSPSPPRPSTVASTAAAVPLTREPGDLKPNPNFHIAQNVHGVKADMDGQLVPGIVG
jgi:hypothetical protein